jgi:hypothetical protein
MKLNRLLVGLAIGTTTIVVAGSTAFATHLTSVTISPPVVTVAAGATAVYSGNVNADTDCGINQSYGWNLSASQGALSITSQAVNAADVTPYMLVVPVAASTAPGTYPVTVTADWVAGPGCIDGDNGVATASLVVVKGCNEADGWFPESTPALAIFDKNGDGWICTKFVNGQGNSANTQRPPGQTGYHVDGHNHKDNN